MSNNEYSLDVEVQFPKEKHAEIAYKALKVDKEPNRSQVVKTLRVEGDKLIAFFEQKIGILGGFPNTKEAMTTHDFPHNSPAPTPSRANYGFILYLTSSTAFIVYCIWAIDFDRSLCSTIGLTYLPQVYWAIALPIFVLVSITFTGLIFYPAINFITNKPFQEKNIETKPISEDTCVPPLVPIPMTQVSKRLYLD